MELEITKAYEAANAELAAAQATARQKMDIARKTDRPADWATAREAWLNYGKSVKTAEIMSVRKDDGGSPALLAADGQAEVGKGISECDEHLKPSPATTPETPGRQ